MFRPTMELLTFYYTLKSESQKYNQESESDTAFACVAGPAECITGDSWRPEG